MRKKLLLSCLSVIALTVLGIGANADMFKPYERYEIPVETADIIVEETEETDEIVEEIMESTKTKEEDVVVAVADKKNTSSSEGKKEEMNSVDKDHVHEEKTD